MPKPTPDNDDKPEPQPSPARVLVSHVWHNQWQSGRKAYIRLNHSMRHAVELAIEAGMRFDEDDFAFFYKNFRGGYWFYGQGGHEGEGFYAAAASIGHTSACQSFEKWRGRPAFIQNGNRLYVGAKVEGMGERSAPGLARSIFEVTSFSLEGTHLTVGEYVYDGATRKFYKTHMVTLESLRTGERAKRAVQKVPAWAKPIVARVKEAGACSRGMRLARAICAEGTPEKFPETRLNMQVTSFARRNFQWHQLPPEWAKVLGIKRPSCPAKKWEAAT